jgi:hypothetical protein
MRLGIIQTIKSSALGLAEAAPSISGKLQSAVLAAAAANTAQLQILTSPLPARRPSSGESERVARLLLERWAWPGQASGLLAGILGLTARHRRGRLLALWVVAAAMRAEHSPRAARLAQGASAQPTMRGGAAAISPLVVPGPGPEAAVPAAPMGQAIRAGTPALVAEPLAVRVTRRQGAPEGQQALSVLPTMAMPEPS